jgi:hypothetical protein
MRRRRTNKLPTPISRSLRPHSDRVKRWQEEIWSWRAVLWPPDARAASPAPGADGRRGEAAGLRSLSLSESPFPSPLLALPQATQPSRRSRLLDHVIRPQQERRGDRESESLRSPFVDDQLEPRGLSQRQLTRPSTIEDLCDLLGSDPINLGSAASGAARRPPAAIMRKVRRCIIRADRAPAVVPVAPRQGSVLSHAVRQHRNRRSAAGSRPSHEAPERRPRDLTYARAGSSQRSPDARGNRFERSQPGCSRGSLGLGLPGHGIAWRALSYPNSPQIGQLGSPPELSDSLT